jgi:hypothetical protein
MKQARPWMLANLKIICWFQAHPVHQNSVDIFWAETCLGRLFFRVESSLIQSNSRYLGTLYIFVSIKSSVVYQGRMDLFAPMLNHFSRLNDSLSLICIPIWPQDIFGVFLSHWYCFCLYSSVSIRHVP